MEAHDYLCKILVKAEERHYPVLARLLRDNNRTVQLKSLDAAKFQVLVLAQAVDGKRLAINLKRMVEAHFDKLGMPETQVIVEVFRAWADPNPIRPHEQPVEAKA